VTYPVGIVCVATLYRQSILLAGVLAVLAAATLSIARRPGDVLILAGGALLGPIAEIVAVAHGAWTYDTPDFLGIPLWLPVGWGLATLLIKRICEGLGELRSGRSD
jgi:hypothetical protein